MTPALYISPRMLCAAIPYPRGNGATMRDLNVAADRVMHEADALNRETQRVLDVMRGDGHA